MLAGVMPQAPPSPLALYPYYSPRVRRFPWTLPHGSPPRAR
jgi:hypothetical protein